jgi:uncharacterized protein (UPF0276 family)
MKIRHHDQARAAAPIPAAAGIGLRYPHHQTVITERPPLPWFEVHAENYLGAGVAADDLRAIRRDYPISIHATGLSLGSAQGLDREHLLDVADLCRQIEPGLVSDHLSWSATGGRHLPDLLPLPYDDESLAVLTRNIDQAQSVLGRTILVENLSTCLAFSQSDQSEAQFLGELVAVTGCGLLLDINNLVVSAGNLGGAARESLKAMLDYVPPAAVGEIHLAGHAARVLADGAVLLIDDHGSPVGAEVWSLYVLALERLGPRPTLIEWDTAIQSLDVLAAEAAHAGAILTAAPWEALHAAG